MADRVKIQIVPLGDWKGHSAGEQHYGEAEALAMVERANRLVSESGNPLQIDYEHASLDPPASGAPAAGWMHSFTLDNDGIYADVEWTPKAQEYIKSGEYKYISPVISMGGKDPVTGEDVPIELFNAALTNQPFMHDKIKQVMATVSKAKGYADYYTNTITISNIQGGNMPDLKETVDAIVAALPGAQSGEDVMAFLKKALDLMATMPGAPAGAPPTPDQMGEMEMAMKKVLANSKAYEDLAAELKVEPDKVLPTVAAFRTKAEGTTDAEKQIAELTAFKKRAEIRELVEEKSEFIPPAKRDEVKAFAEKYGIEATREYVNSAYTAKIPGSSITPPDPPKDDKTPSPEFVKLRKAKNRTDEQIQTEWANLHKTKEA